jgi:hypothetical protein
VAVEAPLLVDVQLRKEILEAAEQELEAAVKRAREGGQSWEKIAGALGVKRQSAQQRYGKAANGGD